MSLAITAGSLPTLRPLYKTVAKKFSWKTSFFSAQKSGHASRATLTVGGSALSRKQLDYTSCSESERKIVTVDSEDYVLQNQGPMIGAKLMGITQTTHIHVNLEQGGKI